ncbi:MAG: adenylyltransferase/cytidyltransferase family protein [Thermoleophilia bacterium]
MRRRITVVGDVLLDADLDGTARRLCPDAPAPVVEAPVERARPGGAGLAAWMLARDGHEVTLVAAPGAGPAGDRLRVLLDRCGVTLVDVGDGGTGVEKIRVRAGGLVLLRLDRGEPAGVTAPGDDARAALTGADAVLAADYGLGVCAHPGVRALLESAGAPVVWDPHPAGRCPCRGAALVTPQRRGGRGHAGAGDPAVLRSALRADAVAVTHGAEGAELADGAGPAVLVPAPRLHVPRRHPRRGRPLRVGRRGGPRRRLRRAGGVRTAVRSASAFVAAGGVAAFGEPGTPSRPPDAGGDAVAVARAVRERGGTVVATGGCFDLLHAGHVASLEAARSLGDCLVVLLNGDDSVRRLKGPDRPVVGQEDRAAVLRGLRAVDAVMVFHEDDPVAALRRLRPHVFAKGADYDPERLPEAGVMHGLGGRVVPLPFVAGRSTTRLISEVTARARS